MKKLKFYTSIALMQTMLFGLVSSNAEAQLKTPSSVGKYEKGTITLKNGKEIDGFVYIDMLNPQEFQKRVNLINEKTHKAFLKGKKIKKDIQVYKAKDLQTFRLDNGQNFKKCKYINPFATRKQDMLPKSLMLEVVTDGKVTVYKKHHHTQGIVSSYLPNRTKVSDAEYVEFQKNNFEILYQKEGQGTKNMSTMNIKALVGDNEMVLSNYVKDYYGFKTLFTKGPVFESSFQLDALEAFTQLVDDYNNE